MWEKYHENGSAPVRTEICLPGDISKSQYDRIPPGPLKKARPLPPTIFRYQPFGKDIYEIPKLSHSFLLSQHSVIFFYFSEQFNHCDMCISSYAYFLYLVFVNELQREFPET